MKRREDEAKRMEGMRQAAIEAKKLAEAKCQNELEMQRREEERLRDDRRRAEESEKKAREGKPKVCISY